MKVRLTAILAVALVGIALLGSTAGPVQASDKIVVNVTGQLTQVSGPDLGPGFVLKVGGHAQGTADDLSGWATDVQVKGNPAGRAGTRGSYCLSPVDGSLVGSVVTLEGAVTFTNSTLPLIGVEVELIADASTGEITY